VAQGEPWLIDPSDGFLALGLAAAAAIALRGDEMAPARAMRARRRRPRDLLWSLHIYMPIAGTHWGMRDAMRAYYDQRTTSTEQKLVYFGLGELYDDWRAAGDSSIIRDPRPLDAAGRSADDGDDRRSTKPATSGSSSTRSAGRLRRGGPAITRRDHPRPRRARQARAAALRCAGRPRGRPPIRVVDADRIVSWHLYWRGENFWSGEEIWGALPEHKATFSTTPTPHSSPI